MKKISMDIETPAMKKWRKKLETIERKKRAEIDRKIIDAITKGEITNENTITV